jgi:hypothetical protein
LSPESTQSGYPAPTSPRRDSFRPATPFTTVHESIHMSESRVQAATTHVIPDSTDSNEDSSGMLFPPDSLVRNIHRFMRYSSAAYGVSPCTFSRGTMPRLLAGGASCGEAS